MCNAKQEQATEATEKEWIVEGSLFFFSTDLQSHTHTKKQWEYGEELAVEEVFKHKEGDVL